MVGDLADRRWAEGEVVSRVTARMVKGGWEEEEEELRSRRASITAPPCLPVAPVMRRALDILVVVWGVGRLVGEEGE